MGDTVWYLNSAEGPVGPYAPVDLKQMVAAGQVTGEWYVWREGFAEWMRIADVPELSAPAAAPAPPPQPPVPHAHAAASQPANTKQSGANVLARAVAAKAQTYGGVAGKPGAAATPAADPAVPRGASTGGAVAEAPSGALAAATVPGGASGSIDDFPEPVIIRAPSRGKQMAKSLGRIAGILAVLAVIAGGVGYYQFGDDLFVMLGLVDPPPPPPTPVPTMSAEEKSARETFARYQAAIEAGDLGALEELVSIERAARISDGAGEALLAELRANRPETPATIAGADVTPEAVTFLLAAPGPAGKLSGSAVVAREEGAWRVASETWQLPPPDTAALEAALFDASVPGTGTAALAKDTVQNPAFGPESDVLRLVTGAEGATDFSDSRRAVMEFRSGVGASARRLEIAFDAARRGRQKIDGQQASLSFIASNAQVFAPDGEVFLEVVQPYSGSADGVCRAVIKRATLSAGGDSFSLAIAIEIRGIPVRPGMKPAEVMNDTAPSAAGTEDTEDTDASGG